MKIFKINKIVSLRLSSCLLLIAFTFLITSFSFALTPVITSSATISNVANTSFGYSIVATNTPTSYSVTGTLPLGLILNTTTGVISGTPSVVGTYNVTFNAINASGTGSLSATITILPPPPVITSSGTANGVAGSAFSFSVIATNTPTSYTATGLPSGLSINTSTGVITGTVATAGNYNATITASNTTGNSGPQALTIIICTNTLVTISGTTTCLVPGPTATILTASPSHNYAWTATSGSFNSTTGGAYAPATSVGYHSSANGTVTATYTTGGCTSTATVSVSIAPPQPTVDQPFYCTTGTTFTVRVTNYITGSTGKYKLVYWGIGGATYNDFLVTTSEYSADASGNITINVNPTITPTSQAVGAYKLYYDDPICGLTTNPTIITFTKTPVVTIAQTISCASTGSITLTASPAASSIGSYSWTVSQGTAPSPSTGNSTTYTGNGNPTITTAIYTSIAGCTSVGSLNLSVVPTGGYSISGQGIYCGSSTPTPSYTITGTTLTDNVTWAFNADISANANFNGTNNSTTLTCSNCLQTSLNTMPGNGQAIDVNGIFCNLGGSIYDLSATVNGCTVTPKQIILGTPNPKVIINYTTHNYSFTPTFGISSWSWVADGVTSTTVSDVMTGSAPFLSTATSIYYTTDNSPVFLLNYNTCGYSGENYNRPEFVPIDSAVKVPTNYTISPNPANDIVNVNGNDNATINAIIIYDISGARKKYITYSQVQKAIISISDLANGTYLVEIFNGKNTQTQKIVIQR